MNSLNEYNQKRFEFYELSNKPSLNGITCPECKKELYDTEPNVILTSNPPKKNIGCPKDLGGCGYRGYAFT